MLTTIRQSTFGFLLMIIISCGISVIIMRFFFRPFFSGNLKQRRNSNIIPSKTSICTNNGPSFEYCSMLITRNNEVLQNQIGMALFTIFANRQLVKLNLPDNTRTQDSDSNF